MLFPALGVGFERRSHHSRKFGEQVAQFMYMKSGKLWRQFQPVGASNFASLYLLHAMRNTDR
jgi:hypothetical protein